MPWRVKYLNAYFAELEDFPVTGAIDLIARFSIWAVDDFRLCLSRQIDMPGNKIGMEMRFEHKSDRGISLCRQCQIRSCFSQGINDRRLPFGFNIVSRFGQTVCVQLFDIHNSIRQVMSPAQIS